MNMSESDANKKKFNPAKDFNDRFSTEVQHLLHIPLVAKCKENNELVPYEYSKHTLKYRRNEDELNFGLSQHAPKLVMYCLKNKIDKSNIVNFKGGNLWSHDNAIKSYTR